MMRLWFAVELCRRGVSLLGLLLAVSGFLLGWSLLQIGLAAGFAIVWYVVLPREKRTPDMQSMSFLPAVFGLDLAGLVLSLPLMFLVVAAQLDPGIPKGWMVALFISPVILSGWVMLFMAARNATLWIDGSPEHLHFASARQVYRFAPDDVAAITPFAFSLPKWAWTLLALFGGPRGAGMAMLHGGRKASYLKFTLRDGRRVTLPVDGFPAVQAFQAHWQARGLT